MTKIPEEILVVDDTPSNIELLFETLNSEGYKVLVASNGEAALEQLQHSTPQIILLDVMMPGMNGFETCRAIKANENTREIPILFMTALADTQNILTGFEAGGVDYITKPFQIDEVLVRIRTHLTIRRLREELKTANNSLEQRVELRTKELKEALIHIEELKDKLEAENKYLQQEINVTGNFDEIIGSSPALKNVLSQVEQVAATGATVLLLGETGTGKELFARAVHRLSTRNERPFIKVNCAALPVNLIESELFGHEKGAFTGALKQKIGRFELADKGTIFLDEIGDLPLELQAKLLRVLQEGEFERIGDTKTQKVDIRVIAATNRDIEEEVSEGRFREDLFYRLNVFPVELPPLRNRKEDIVPLTEFFVHRYSRKMGKPINSIHPETIDQLNTYPFPGNVRELENIIERAVILCKDKILTLEKDFGTSKKNRRQNQNELTSLDEMERRYITYVLEEVNWVIEGKKGAALILDMNPSTLRTRMQKLNIQRP